MHEYVQGDLRIVTVLFLDLHGFTAMSENMPPDEVTLTASADSGCSRSTRSGSADSIVVERRASRRGRYFVDFISHSARLVIELDGSHHALQSPYDEERTRFLQFRTAASILEPESC